jgi:hypothetical protein
VLRNSYTLFFYGLGYVIISLLQIDTPEAGVQISSAAQQFGISQNRRL